MLQNDYESAKEHLLTYLHTASNLGMICKRRPTYCANAIKHIKSITVQTKYMNYGKTHENEAREMFKEQTM